MALQGIQVVEMLGSISGSFCGTILADFEATVTVVQKIDSLLPFDIMGNGKKILPIDLKSKEGVDVIRRLCATADILLDPFRPGVMEKLGLGPELLMKDNPGLIYARLTGYGQSGDYKSKSGHDINFEAMSGILSTLSEGKPPEPSVYIASFAGGSLNCAIGILLALFERSKSGKGQIVDSSITEGAAYLTTWLHKVKRLPIGSGETITNALGGGLPWYRTYKTKDGKFMAVGALEPKFYSNFLNSLQLPEEDYPQSNMEHCRSNFEEIFQSKTQEEWCVVFSDVDACVTPVLPFSSADEHILHTSRKSFYRDSEGLLVPETAPRLSCTPGVSTGRKNYPVPGHQTRQILKELGYNKNYMDDLISRKIVYAAEKSRL